MELIRQFRPGDYARALDSWQWLPVRGKRPVFASPFGDLFLDGPDGVWYLDTLEGSLTRNWADPDALAADLDTADGQDRYLAARLVLRVGQRGLAPAPDQVYAFRVAPVLGGPIDVGNVEVADFVITVNLIGRLHQQLRDVPPSLFTGQ